LEEDNSMIPANETFGGSFPFDPHFSAAPGFRMHYVDEGNGEPVVCLHGEPTWGYLYRRFIPLLAHTHRVVVPDHMGFGKSETPQDREYTLRTHVENLEALIGELDLHDITFVLQDWGGAIGGDYTVRNPARVKRLFLINTLLADPPPPAGDFALRLFNSRWFQWITKHYSEGTLEQVLGNLGSTVLSVMKIIGFENSAAVDDAWIDAYSAPFPTRQECKGAIAFPLDAVNGTAMQFDIGSEADFETLWRKPAMLAEGMRDHAIPPDLAIERFRARYPQAPVVELPNAGHFCQEDAPETLVALLQQFLQSS
jgi:pimeloyl-ACP methyl ester carboxylesterase